MRHDLYGMQSTRETCRTCEQNQCTFYNTTLPCPRPPHPLPSKPQPILTTATQTPATATITRHSKHSLVTLQHVRFAPDKSLDARDMTSMGCHVQGRRAEPGRTEVPAHAHVSEPPTPQPFPAPGQNQSRPCNTNSHNRNHHSSLKPLTCCAAARPLCKQSALRHNPCVRLMLLQVLLCPCHTNQ